MKTPAALAVSLLALTVPVSAEIKIPKTVLRVAQYDEALQQAKTQKKPLAIVMMDEFAEGKGAEETAEETFKALSGSAVVLLVSTARKSEEAYQLAPPFLTALVDSGISYIPAVLIGPPSEDVIWKTISPSSAKQNPKDLRKALRDGVAEVKPKVTAYFSAKEPPPIVQPDKPLVWARAKESGYKGKFVKVEGEKIFITNEKGEAGGIDFTEFKPATVRYAKMLAGQPAGEAAPATADAKPAGKPAAEKWTNDKGVEIEATFVKLAGGKVTLRLASGKDAVLPLTSLSAASQARAQELAAAAGK